MFYSQRLHDKPVVRVPGCPPIAEVMTGVLTYVLTFGRLPELDRIGRPKMFYGQRIHDKCYRRSFFDAGQFVERWDDEGARKGWCLYKLGCKGPVTYNACATAKWNGGVSWPVESGHGCIGCSEPAFWDRGGFYQPLSQATMTSGTVLGVAAAAGLAVGVGAALMGRGKNKQAQEEQK
jgi:hydrogenase small subunit